MGCCFSKGESKDEMKPLLEDKDEVEGKTKATKTSKLEFAKLEVREFDKIFEDFARTLNPFVTDREKLEQSVTKFKTSVESINQVRPQATFREYLKTLKTTLKNEGIFIKIKNGAVELYGVGSRSVKAVQDAVDAIKTIMSASEALKDMPETVTLASSSAAQDVESSAENLEHIIRREFSGVLDGCKIIRFKKNLSNNLKKMRSSPQMVTDFCEEVKIIVQEISKAFDEDKAVTDDDDDNDGDNGNKENAGKDGKKKEETKDGEENHEVNKKKGEKSGKEIDVSTKDEKNNEKGKDAKNKDKKKRDYQKELKMETVGLPDIDKMFEDVMTTLNRFVTNREKLQQAKESFEKIMKTLSNFDGEQELKEYINELKKKAKDGKIHIYVDLTDGHIKLDSVKGVDPPAPYRNAVKALNDVKAAAETTVDLEPNVQNGLEACAKDVTNIDPLKDFKKMVSRAKEVMKLPKKVKAFNENRKTVQKAPQIVKEFCQCVKQILVDIAKAFTEEESEDKEERSDEKRNGENKDKEKEEESGNEKDDENENENETECGNEKDDKHEVIAIVHAPKQSDNDGENKDKDKDKEKDKEKEEESGNEKDDENENENETECGNEKDDKHEVIAIVHTPKQSDNDKMENKNTVA